MNDEGRPLDRPSVSPLPRLARPPALVMRLEIEQPPQLRIEAESFEDEQRLRLWLERSGALSRFGRAA